MYVIPLGIEPRTYRIVPNAFPLSHGILVHKWTMRITKPFSYIEALWLWKTLCVFPFRWRKHNVLKLCDSCWGCPFQQTFRKLIFKKPLPRKTIQYTKKKQQKIGLENVLFSKWTKSEKNLESTSTIYPDKLGKEEEICNNLEGLCVLRVSGISENSSVSTHCCCR